MKTNPLHSFVTLGCIAILHASFITSPHLRADDARKGAPESEERKPKAKKKSSEKRNSESSDQADLRKKLDETARELTKVRESLHEAHKELGAKAELISTLESKLSSVTAQLEKSQSELKKALATTSGGDAKLQREFEAEKKKVGMLEAELKSVRKMTEEAVAEAKAAAKKVETTSKPLAPKEKPSKTAGQTTRNPSDIAPVVFDKASAVNYPERDRVLAEISAALRKSPNSKFVLTGYADDSPYRQTNEDVSNNRAGFLAAYLVINGIPEDRLVTKGRGNSSSVKGIPNRRVEIEQIR